MFLLEFPANEQIMGLLFLIIVKKPRTIRSVLRLIKNGNIPTFEIILV